MELILNSFFSLPVSFVSFYCVYQYILWASFWLFARVSSVPTASILFFFFCFVWFLSCFDTPDLFILYVVYARCRVCLVCDMDISCFFLLETLFFKYYFVVQSRHIFVSQDSQRKKEKDEEEDRQMPFWFIRHFLPNCVAFVAYVLGRLDGSKLTVSLLMK